MKTDTDTTAKTRSTGKTKTASPPTASLLRLALNTLTNQRMQQHQQTPEQKDADTRRFVIRSFAVGLVGLLFLFGYSIVYTEQPLFNEAPADKAIFAVLTLVIGQLLTILANYISRTPPPNTQSFNRCPPEIKKEVIVEEIKTPAPTMPKPTFAPKPFMANPNERPPL